MTQPKEAISMKGHTPLHALEQVCGDIFDRWDQDMRSGKLLTALSGMMPGPGYDPRVDQIRRALDAVPDLLGRGAELQAARERHRLNATRENADTVRAASDAFDATLTKATLNLSEIDPWARHVRWSECGWPAIRNPAKPCGQPTVDGIQCARHKKIANFRSAENG